MTIKSIMSDEFIQGIPDKYGFQELKANSLGRQILNQHGYQTHKLMNFNSDLFPDVDFDMGIDEAIFRSKIPKEDRLQLKKLNSHFDDMTITIDYKSNNLRDNNSIYVKLKPYVNKNKYFLHTKNGKEIDPIVKYWHKPYAEIYYINHQILSRENRSDIIIYMKYDKHPDYFELKQAYLIGRDTLQNQVVNILNQVLAEIGYPQITNDEGSLRINQKITKTYLIVQEDPTILKKGMELVRIRKHSHDNGDIMLRIPERYLDSYIKVDGNGNIA